MIVNIEGLMSSVWMKEGCLLNAYGCSARSRLTPGAFPDLGGFAFALGVQPPALLMDAGLNLVCCSHELWKDIT